MPSDADIAALLRHVPPHLRHAARAVIQAYVAGPHTRRYGLERIAGVVASRSFEAYLRDWLENRLLDGR